MSIELSILLPAYLEEENLRLLLPRIKNNMQELLADSFEIIVIDTQKSMDGTREACKQIGVNYINRKHGNHYGDAIRTGIDQAKGKYIDHGF
jgi:dolichol-phosphate mannosyltransferase